MRIRKQNSLSKIDAGAHTGIAIGLNGLFLFSISVATEDNLRTGYIRVFRSIRNHWLYPKNRKFTTYEAFTDLLFLTNHCDNKVPIDNGFVVVSRGSFITSLKKLCERWRWGHSELRTFLKNLQKDQMICIHTTTKYTQITICNYDFYQGDLQTNGKPKTNQRKTKNKPTDTNNNDKELKQYKWRESFSDYIEDCNRGYKEFFEKPENVKKAQELNPGIDIRRSIENGYVTFWGTEAGWNNKKSKKTLNIDWKATIFKSIQMNKVPLQK